MRSLSAAYLLRQVYDLRLKVATPPSPRRPAGYVISQSTFSANAKGAPIRVPLCLAEKVGFEPTRRVNGLRDFESRLFDHLSTSP